MSNRFQCLETSSDCDESPKETAYNDVVLSLDQTTSVLPSEQTEGNTVYCLPSLDGKNLVTNSIKLIMENPEKIKLGTAMQQLWNMMRGYTKATAIDSFQIARLYRFTHYIRETQRKFFEQIAYHSEGSYQGSILSMWSWRLPAGGKIYICTCEGFGSCALCDHIEGLSDDLCTLRYSLHDLRDEFKLSSDRTFIRKISDKVDEIRKLMDDHVTATFSRLKFFETFGEAKRFCIDHAESHIEFKKPEKRVPGLNQRNFPSLGK